MRMGDPMKKYEKQLQELRDLFAERINEELLEDTEWELSFTPHPPPHTIPLEEGPNG